MSGAKEFSYVFINLFRFILLYPVTGPVYVLHCGVCTKLEGVLCHTDTEGPVPCPPDEEGGGCDGSLVGLIRGISIYGSVIVQRGCQIT